MATKLLLHIGQAKTGTTTIQEFLRGHRRHLRREGILYPSTGCQSTAHHKIARLFLRNAEKGRWIVNEDPESLKDRFFAEVDKVQPHTVILSSEVFFHAGNLQELKSWFSGFDISIVVFLRRQDQLADSLYQHQLKTAATDLDHVEWLHSRARLLNYADRVGRWGDAFGDAAIRIGVFEWSRIATGLMAYFFRIANIPTNIDLHEPSARNVRLSRDALEYLHIAANKGLAPNDRKLLRAALEEYSRLCPDPPKWHYFFSPDERTTILKNCAQSNAQIAQRFLPHSGGVLFNDVEIESEFEHYPGLTAETRIRIEAFCCRVKSTK